MDCKQGDKGSVGEKRNMKYEKTKKIIEAGEIIHDWEIYDAVTEEPYIVLTMRGSDGKDYEVTADIQYIEAIRWKKHVKGA